MSVSGGPARRPAVAVDPAAPVPALLDALTLALDGGPALAPLAAGPLRDLARLGDGVESDGADDSDVDVALLLPTSGSTGEPKIVELGAAALRHSAAATHERLGGPGRWLLALPRTHVAGWQVLVRSALSGMEPVVMDTTKGFDAAEFARAATGVHAARRYTSLVPTQLSRLLDHQEATEALTHLDAVLLGGSAASAKLLERARTSGVHVVTTYGMTETCGGCVYDGQPLDGVRARAENGRILISGPVLARGYRGEPRLTAQVFPVLDGDRWFVTSDAGEVDDGRLTVSGRLDDVLVTGGVNVAPATVEAALARLPGVADCVVVGVPDPEWGQAVTAVVVPTPAAEREPAPRTELTTTAVREALRLHLQPSALPRHVVVVDALPLRGPGKPDRAAAADLARAAVTGGG